MIHWTYFVLSAPLFMLIGGHLYRAFYIGPATPAVLPPGPIEGRCCYLDYDKELPGGWHYCTAYPDPRCGSGYCIEDCLELCERRCFDPLRCKNCDKPIHEHGPGKCLFGPTTYEAAWARRKRKKATT